ncbi:RNA-binding protein, putative [Plasmodium knowlesi strain H]|uniref:RNA-binding protein, putative n=2 Tax=Plasmodium knowlesi TaxID=5850 RepID=B3L410_PLAKH|nr:RNA-binding protein, putative [Plasmodium knowlesi strain H]OTN65768.1 putative Rna-binding protein [Plasmodium knowlesi]CAA9987860.1 RNA-binding protein, putative [Plasmodium knowlesi strain H]VVS77334.1 RNA-binding protein, putative [Plasmodium knowlesi strain H]|eukprot:XP_002258858.1 rna-binding protein, putative [Plasmodium knowlesi strain H]
MGIFDKIRSVEKLNEAELKNIGNDQASWHDQYKDSSYIYIGNLDSRLTEGDIVIVFSQFGEPIDVNLVRDKETGKSKGYCFLSYEDQRSTVLAVDNFNGYKLLDRPLVVDHILNYRLPQKYANDDGQSEYKPSGAEGQGIGVHNVIESEINLTKTFERIRNKQSEEKRKELMDEDELWALNFEKSLNKGGDKGERQSEHRRSTSSDNVKDRRKRRHGERSVSPKRHKRRDRKNDDDMTHIRDKHKSHRSKGGKSRKRRRRSHNSGSSGSSSRCSSRRGDRRKGKRRH